MKGIRTTLVAVVALALTIVLGYCVLPGQQVVFDGTGEFGRVRVLERQDGLRALFTGAGRARQSAIYPGRPRHLELAYSRVAMIGLAMVNPDARILFVGLGGGAMPMYTRQVLPLATSDVVELDPLIVEVAQSHFGFLPDERLRVHTGDGRAFIEAAPPGTYDLIFLDAFSDDEIPFTLSTREFLTAVRAAMKPDGVVVSNLWSSVDEYQSMLATYQAVFAQVHLVWVPGANQRIVIGTSRSEPVSEASLLAAADALSGRTELGFDLRGLVGEGYEGRSVSRAEVLEDR